MSRYVRNPTKTFNFDGDEITVSFKPLTALDLAQLSDGATRSDEVRLMGSILEKTIVKIDGLIDAEGVQIDIQTVCHDAYFVGFAAEMFKSLVEFSQPSNP